MSKATMSESPTAQLVAAEGAMSSDESAMAKPPVDLAASGMGESPVQPDPLGSATVREITEMENPLIDLSPSDKASESDGFAVQLTEEEWLEQDRLAEEFSDAIVSGDRKLADEVLPKIIWPSFMLKATKKLFGADYIRKRRYNTTDADMVYGPGWLDIEDGGPAIKRNLL